MILITASEFNRSVDKYLTLADKEEVMITRGRWNSKYYLLTPMPESESLPIRQTNFPCQYTPKEMIRRMKQGVIDTENGKGKTIEELRTKPSRNQ